MAAPRPPLQEARVLWWNEFGIYVRCPFCDAIHYHGFAGYPVPSHSISRQSDCFRPRSGTYRLLFPFDEAKNEAWYSIDKTRGLFVAGGELPPEYFRKFESEDDPTCSKIRFDAKKALDTKPKWHEANETIAVDGIPMDLNAHETAVSDLVCGRYAAVQRYLDSSKEANIFLHGIEEYLHEIPPDESYDDEEDSFGEKDGTEEKTVDRERHTTGRTTLHYAACENHPNLTRLLLDRGADPNAQDIDGRTPLAESCLWGRRDNVLLLLQHEAKNDIFSVRDGQRYLPVDFARDTKENIEERHRRSGGVYKEDTYERDKDRKFIVTLLENATQELSHDDGNQRSLWGSAFTKAPHDATMITFTAHFDVPSQYKTIGVLYRGARFPTVAAMSGWGHSEWDIDNVHVAGRSWTKEVHSLCQRIGFKLDTDRRDRGIPGWFNACHAEKQLIAYFVDQHFLDVSQGEAEETLDPALIVPPVSVRSAEIMVSRDVCDDCKRFVRRVNEALDLDISVVASVC